MLGLAGLRKGHIRYWQLQAGTARPAILFKFEPGHKRAGRILIGDVKLHHSLTLGLT